MSMIDKGPFQNLVVLHRPIYSLSFLADTTTGLAHHTSELPGNSIEVGGLTWKHVRDYVHWITAERA